MILGLTEARDAIELGMSCVISVNTDISNGQLSDTDDAAAYRAWSYVNRGFSSARLLDVLANYASRDSALVTEGLNLVLADACAAEVLATKAAEPAMALARTIAASPSDWTAYRSWEPLLAP